MQDHTTASQKNYHESIEMTSLNLCRHNSRHTSKRTDGNHVSAGLPKYKHWICTVSAKYTYDSHSMLHKIWRTSSHNGGQFLSNL